VTRQIPPLPEDATPTGATLQAGLVRLTADLEAGGLGRVVVALGEAVPLVIVFAPVGVGDDGWPSALRGYLLMRGVEQHFDIPVARSGRSQPLASSPPEVQ
jgi:hypothetical protein